jgi:hypothetical protein
MHPDMPFFRVLIEGTNLSLPSEGEEGSIVGFFTSRVLWSNTLAGAETKALASVKRLWETGNYATQPSAKQLVLSISESSPSTFRQWLSAPNKGHAFFAANQASEA